jgi:hypothetical protein
MTDEKKPTDPKPVTEDKAASAHKITRRRFTKAGAVAPVIMTLGARPVWGQTACVASVSGEQSGNASPGHVYRSPGTSGFSALWWKQHPGDWPTGYGLLGTAVREGTTDPGQNQDNKVVITRNGSDYRGLFAIYRSSTSASVSSLIPCAESRPIYSALDLSLEKEVVAATLNSLKFQSGDFGYSIQDIKQFRCNIPLPELACVLAQLNARSTTTETLPSVLLSIKGETGAAVPQTVVAASSTALTGGTLVIVIS